MTSDKKDLTDWFDSQLDGYKSEFDKLGGVKKSSSSGSTQARSAGASSSSTSSTSPSSIAPVIAPTPVVAPASKGGSAPAAYTPQPQSREPAPAPEARKSSPPAKATAKPVASSGPAPRKRTPAGGDYLLGVDVGGTFTDLLLIEEASGQTFTAKVPSTPQDSSVGVLNGVEKICGLAGIEPTAIGQVMHGTTVATNTVLTGSGAKVGLVMTKGYKQTLQIARSYVPGGLGGWVIFNKTDPLAPLELTIEADERMSAKGETVDPLNEQKLRTDLADLAKHGIEALTVSLMNSYTNGAHERRIREIAQEVMPGVPISISSEIVPEMYEYERAETTVVNSYIRPVVGKYIENLMSELDRRTGGTQLHILRSDGGLSSADAAKELPVNLLMSGPAGGVSGAIWMAKQAGYKDLLTFDMGGTSTDVALI
ncbi:MAG: hydantoinase/oxoprolinase family protein, partial [Alphaproteobacteria bacterium]|nr:hydantoinase/oxoprolinase family protein [Alphaproteobacteria bacterium]